MEKKVIEDTNGCEKEHFDKLESEKNADRVLDEEEDDDSISGESDALLPSRKGGISRGVDKAERKVQWNDRNGEKLAEVLEYEPSIVDSDSDDEDKDSCFCCVM